MWNLHTTTMSPFGLNLSDVDHFSGKSFFLQLVANPLYEPVDYVRPVSLHLIHLFIRQLWQGCCREGDLVFAG